MTPEETVLLTRYVKACCPQQAIDRYTPDAWYDLLREFGAGECRAAAAAVAMRQPFVAPSEIIAEVERERRAVIGRARRAALDQGATLAVTPAERVIALDPEPGARQPPAINSPVASHDRRDHLKDPRPLRETIRAIIARHGGPELT
jgi:hypothetical protein